MEEKIYDALTIAKSIINKIHPVPLTLQKLLYFSQGYSYTFYNRPLFLDDMEGWVHGPVVKSVYHMFKDYKYNPIDVNFEVYELDEDANNVISYVINNYTKFNDKYLETLIHHQEPWILSRQGLDPDERNDKTILKENIANYFVNEIFQPEDVEWDY